MGTVWEGNVLTDTPANDGCKVHLQNILLCSPSVSSDDGPIHIDFGSKLRFRAFVEVNRVPIYLAHGPTLVVYSGDAETEESLWETLVASQVPVDAAMADAADIDGANGCMNRQSTTTAATHSSFESGVGMLLEVKGGDGPVSEVLLYAAEESIHTGNAARAPGLITPPRSSSPTLPENGHDGRDDAVGHSIASTIRVFAQPLRSLASFTQFLRLPPSPAASVPADYAQFLTLEDQRTSAESSGKRPKLDDVFSAANSATRRARRAGGASVSQLMSSAVRPRGASHARTGSGLSRSLTTGSLLIGARSGTSSRPGSSRAGSVSLPSADIASIPPCAVHQRGPSLHRAASSTSVNTSTGTGTARASLPPLSTSLSEMLDRDVDTPPPPLSTDLAAVSAATDATAEDALAVANKAALSRIVLAALRMWGHAPPGKASRGSRDHRLPQTTTDTMETMGMADVDATESSKVESGQGEQEQEDFKALYHATFSAARFALRHHGLRQRSVPGETMRGVVERVLGVFLGGNVGVGVDLGV